MNHDEFVNFLAREATSFNPNQKVLETKTEEHYNYYGTRGVADLVKIEGNDYGPTLAHVIEAKTHLEKAHETIRQFKKMLRYFYKDEQRSRPKRVLYELTVLPTESNFAHLRAYEELYSAAAGKKVAGHKSKAVITFRGPADYTPIPLFTDTHPEISSDEWWELADTNPEAVSRIKGERN